VKGEKMEIYFYNTLTKQKDRFEPIDSNEVRIYSCGPTVYKDASIGNMRTNILNDILRRVLKYNGYKIKHAMNITDVGHLVSDGDEGEDKMLKSAREEQKSPIEIAEHYTQLFFNDLKDLNIEIPEIVCKATEHIKEMLEYVEKLIEEGYAYETSTAIYFDISKLDKYPILSNLDLENQKAGARVDVDTEKRNPADFALWIKAKPNHLMKWDSQWGPSYPGWHIECSTMGQKYLGEQFDIHTGGIDLVPTHHENEIAQSKGRCGKIPAKFWIHGEYLLINGGKMSKSLKNVFLVRDIKERGYDPLVYKLFSYSCHYRNKLNFTWEGIDAASKSLDRLRNSYQSNLNGNDILSRDDIEKLNQIEENFHKAINDDLNMPLAMSYVWEAARFEKKNSEVAKLLAKFDTVLGIEVDKLSSSSEKEEIPQEILDLVEQRKIARDNKDWAKSDELRDLISEMGYCVKDTKQGMEISKV
jgi:cysteinyl-tRNA synthetase